MDGSETPKEMVNILSHQGNVNQINPKIPPHTSQNGQDQKTQRTAKQWCHTHSIPALGREKQTDFGVRDQPGLQSEILDSQVFT